MPWPPQTVKAPDPSDSSTTNILISASATPTAAPASTIGGNQNPEADLGGLPGSEWFPRAQPPAQRGDLSSIGVVWRAQEAYLTGTTADHPPPTGNWLSLSFRAY
jgi:hypothetical protein